MQIDSLKCGEYLLEIEDKSITVISERKGIVRPATELEVELVQKLVKDTCSLMKQMDEQEVRLNRQASRLAAARKAIDMAGIPPVVYDEVPF